MKTRLSSAIVFFMFLYWALSPNLKGAGNFLLFLLFVLSGAFWRELKNPSLRHWALLLALPFLLTLFQKLFIFEDIKTNVFDAPSRFLLAGACIFAFYQIDANKLLRTLSGTILGAMGLGIWAYVSTHFEPFFWVKGERAWNGFSNPIPFGLLAVIFAMMAISLPHALFPKIPKKTFWTLKIIASAMGFYAAFASLSRVVLLVLPFLVLILIFQNIQKSKKIATSIALLGVVFASAILLVDNPYQDRFLYAFKEVQTVQKNPHTSAGQRFLLWKEAIKIIQKNPMWGIGKNGFITQLQQRQKTGKALPPGVSPSHPHSDYLNFAVEFGLPGFGLLLAFYFVPLGFFLKRLKNDSIHIQTAATYGAMVVVAFALAGVLDSYFWIVNQTTFYGLSVALFVAVILQVENQKNQKKSASTVENDNKKL